MDKKIFFIFLMSCSCIITSAHASQKLFKVINPLSLSQYGEKYASVVIQRLDRSLKKVTITVNAKKSVVVVTNKKRSVYCKTIKLNTGENKIIITGHGKKGSSTHVTLQLFYKSEFYKYTLDAPENYKKHFFHTTVNEKQCKSCHNMHKDKSVKFKKRISVSKINTKAFRVLQNPKRSNCYTCHKTMTLRKNRHAPAAGFLCSACHTGKNGDLNAEDKGKSKYLWEDPVINNCFMCHGSVKKDWVDGISQHGTLERGRCNKCHNPHSSDFEFELRKPIRKLCLTCHPEKENGRHVLGSFVFGRNKGSHPTKDRKDPARPGRDLVCSSCHNPHGSTGVFLLKTKGSLPYSICTRCHKK